MALGAACSDSSKGGERTPEKAADGPPTRPDPSELPLPVSTTPPLPDGPYWYRIAIRSAARAADDALEEIPFFVWIPPGDDDRKAMVANAEQRFYGRRTWMGDRVLVEFPMYHTELDIRRYSDGVLRGQWNVDSQTWGRASLPLRAREIGTLDPAQRFLRPADVGAPEPVDPSGSWHVTFDKSKPAQLIVTRGPNGVVTGVFHFSTGDMVYTTGNVFGSEILLSGFDGTSPFLMTATFDAALNALQGTWVGAPDLGWRESILAYRDARDVALDTPKLALGQDELHLPEMSEAPYRDKPVLVELMGTWCTACSHAAPVLRALYERYHPQGLEVLTYVYEFTADTEYNRSQAQAFVAEHDIPWQVRPIDGTIDNFFDIMPIELTDFNDTSFPILVFVNADATIYDIHAGFPGPEAGDAHGRVVEKYDRRIRALLQVWNRDRAK